MSARPLFAVITVCYQAEDVIEDTIRSVLNQSYKDFEYIIVDGGSTDGTCKIIEKYIKDPRIKYTSEKDKGLYDAMNKGIKRSVGAYINYMNAGDCLADEDVLRDVSEVIKENPRMDFIYGNVLYRYDDGSEMVRKYPWYCSTGLYQLMGDCINHQGLFAKRIHYEQIPFAIDKYRISCYRDWITHQCSLKKKFKAMDRIICRFSFSENSFTALNYKEHLVELDKILKEYYPLGFPIYRMIKAVRNGKTSAKILHRIYEIVFLKKK
ncbi:MAG: glycosyltransferase [Lachnospiraceae bacterium]|nr:glycosyltransferase [Lachnospiraceae bacterium]